MHTIQAIHICMHKIHTDSYKDTYKIHVGTYNSNKGFAACTSNFWTYYCVHICMYVHTLYVSCGEFISFRIRLYWNVSACICIYAYICSKTTQPCLYVLYVSVCMICIVCINDISMQYLHVS